MVDMTAPRLSALLSTLEPVAVPRGPLLLASDSSPASDAAFPMARALAAHTGAPVQVVSALRPNVMPTYVIDASLAVREPPVTAVDSEKKVVEHQVARPGPADAPWDVTVRTGDPVEEIVKQAEETDARVIVVGRGRHDLIDRLLRGESVLRLLQLGNTPVFAVSSDLEVLPGRVVIGTDFSAFSIYAAQVALELIAPDAYVQFVHVAPALGGSAPMMRHFAEEYRAQAAASFAELIAHFRRPGLTFDCKLLDGNASSRLVEHLTEVKADLVVTATHGYGFLKRMVLGSVTAELVRSAPCSMLCIPGSARTLATARAERAAVNQTTRQLSAERLDAALAAFSGRNIGRECTLEVQGADIGVQPIGHYLPLAEVSVDATSGSVVMTFGLAGTEGPHLSHRVSAPVAVELVTDQAGRDRQLRMMHSGGTTQLILD